MHFIFLSAIQSTLIFVAFKLFERYKIDNWQAIVVNYIVATVFGLIIYTGPVSADIVFHKAWLPYAAALGLMFIGTFYFFALSSQKVGVALTSVASKMSLIIPIILGLFIYGERLSPLGIVGILTALTAFWLTFKKGGKLSVDWRLMYLPLLIFLGNGFVDTLMKYTEFYYVSDDLILFLSTIFFFSLIVGILFLVISSSRKKVVISWKNIIGGIALGMVNFGSTFFMLKAMGVFESGVVFPISNAAVVTMSALTGYFVFKEKLSLTNWIGIALAVAAIIVVANA